MKVSQASSPRQHEACRWQTDSRYYRVLVQQDLFGGWELIKVWGGRGNRRGGYKVAPMADQAAALDALDREARRRLRRGYQPCEPAP